VLHLVGILFPHINNDARSKSHQTLRMFFGVLISHLNVSSPSFLHRVRRKRCDGKSNFCAHL